MLIQTSETPSERLKQSETSLHLYICLFLVLDALVLFDIAMHSPFPCPRSTLSYQTLKAHEATPNFSIRCKPHL